MSCKTWAELVSQGESLLREGSPERLRAQRHFAHCPSCAERAFLLDPSWALSRSDRLERLEKPVFRDSEIADLKRNVLEAGRIRAVESSVEPRRRVIQTAVAVTVLAVVLAGGVLLRVVGSFGEAGGASGGPPPNGATLEAIAPSGLGERPRAAGTWVDLSLPTVGSLAPAAARIYDFGQEDFALVMVVHETLDL